MEDCRIMRYVDDLQYAKDRLVPRDNSSIENSYSLSWCLCACLYCESEKHCGDCSEGSEGLEEDRYLRHLELGNVDEGSKMKRWEGCSIYIALCQCVIPRIMSLSRSSLLRRHQWSQ